MGSKFLDIFETIRFGLSILYIIPGLLSMDGRKETFFKRNIGLFVYVSFTLFIMSIVSVFLPITDEIIDFQFKIIFWMILFILNLNTFIQSKKNKKV